MTCVNVNSVEFQTLLRLSGLSEFLLASISGDYLEKYDRFPRLDELPNANSEPYITESLQLKDNATSIQNVLDTTGTNSIEEAVIYLNNTYLDKEITIIPVGKTAIVKINTRPNEYKATLQNETHIDTTAVSLNDSLNKLAELYGIKINAVNSSEVAKMNIPNLNLVKGFIYNGNIYINTDLATVDTPVHELLHLLIGSIKFTNPDLYYSLIDTANNFKHRDYLALPYLGRTRNDLNEELFIGELAKLLTGITSDIESLDNSQEIFYNINRVLDSILMGELTVKSLDLKEVISMNLRQLAEKVKSATFNNVFYGTLDLVEVSRILANKKMELMKNKELEEYCGV